MMPTDDIDTRMVVEWQGFVSEINGDMLCCRMTDLDAADNYATEIMEISKAKFLNHLTESQPDRVQEFMDGGRLLGVVFNLKVDGNLGITTIHLPPPWTEEEVEDALRRGEEAAEKWKSCVRVE